MPPSPDLPEAQAMLMVISPRQNPDYDTPPNTARHTLPDYLARSAELIAQLRS